MDISTVCVPNTIPYDITITIPELPGCRGEAAVTFDDAATAVSALCKVLTAAERLALFAQYCGQCGQAWGWCGCQRDLPRRKYADRTAEGAIEHYYRSKARNSRITLKDVADQTGYNYDYLRRVRREYNAAGKWGAKSKVKT